MEVQSTGRIQRNARQARLEGTAGERTSPKSRAQKQREDRIAISKNILSTLEALNRQTKEDQARKKLDAQANGSSSDLDAVTKALKKMAKCQKIAARIRAGDKVPPEDERFLMDNDIQSYQLAIIMREPKHNPKKWDSVLEDEDREGDSTESTGSEDGSATESGGEVSEA